MLDRSRWRNRKGQSIIEITLITPILLVALYIPADFGIGFFTAHLVQNAAREGARIASKMTPFSSSEVETEVTARLPNTFPWVVESVSAERRTGTAEAECMEVVSVTVTGTYNFFLYRLISLLGFDPPDPITIARTTEMRYEAQKNEFTNPC